jgi:hypothetical protein
VNTLGGEASSLGQPNTPSTMDVEISATPHVCSTTDLPGNEGDRSSKRIKLNPADTVISSEHGTGVALQAANTSEERSFAKLPNVVVKFLDSTVGPNIPAEGVDTAIKDGKLDDTSTEEALLSLSSTPVSRAIPVTNVWDNSDDVEFVEVVELVEASLSQGGSLISSLNEGGNGEQPMDGGRLTRSRARREAQDVDGGAGQICALESTQGKAKVMHSLLEMGKAMA